VFRESAAALSVVRYALITAAQVSRQASAFPDTAVPDEELTGAEFPGSADDPDEEHPVESIKTARVKEANKKW
jgi:hypothetical protein